MPTIDVAGASIVYRDGGAGTPVVALHGTAGGAGMWRGLGDYLGGRFRVIAPDLPGYGVSGVPAASGPLGPELAAVTALASRFGEAVHLVGHGFGGVLALEAARLTPRLVRSLTLIEPSAFHLLDRGRPGDRLLRREVERLAERVTSEAAWDDPEGAMRRFVDYWNGAGAWERSSPGLRDVLLARLPRTIANLAAMRALPGRPDHARIACPTLVVMGLDAPLPSLRASEVVAGLVPGAELRMVAGAGHMAPLTDPHVIDPMIARHLLRAAEPALAIAC